jgi:hypothetical protein
MRLVFLYKGKVQQWPCLFIIRTLNICYESVVLKVDSEPVISFFNRADPFSGFCLFCNFVTNTIYVIKIEMFEPVSMARYHKFDFSN